MAELELRLHMGGPGVATQWKQVMCKACKTCGGMVMENFADLRLLLAASETPLINY